MVKIDLVDGQCDPFDFQVELYPFSVGFPSYSLLQLLFDVQSRGIMVAEARARACQTQRVKGRWMETVKFIPSNIVSDSALSALYAAASTANGMVFPSSFLWDPRFRQYPPCTEFPIAEAVSPKAGRIAGFAVLLNFFMASKIVLSLS